MQDTTALALTAGPRLTEIHRTLQGIGREALGLAVEAGDILRRVKASLPHGGWLPWLAENVPFTDRTARRYIRVSEATEAGKIKSDTVSNLTKAYRLTTEARPPVEETDPYKADIEIDLRWGWHHMGLIEAGDGTYIVELIPSYAEGYWFVNIYPPGIDGTASHVEGTTRPILGDAVGLWVGHMIKDRLRDIPPDWGREEITGALPEYNRMLFTSDREWREFRHQQLTGGR